ncbi:MAG: hypothetical protein DHS20C18_10320 [Saprospiraceae bacterium]|nr:MAG: hypothetical protein DHS20C18_10320 [Saprospiraceae bacterium]
MDRRMIFLLGILASILLFCTRDLPTAQIDIPYRNLADGVKYIGMETCRSCHDNVHSTFIHTGMGKSFGLATREKSAAEYGTHALVYDEKSNFYYKPYFQNDSLYILEYRLENGDTTYQRIEKVHYIVGSGQHTNSHIVDINGYIYQAPITYYTQDQHWDMAPGFQVENERFARLLTTECITCHNHFPEPVAGSLNKFSKMPTGIECERCHGPGELHVREKLSGEIVDTSQFIDYSIVNPRDLPRDLQMDLCQRCHLQGVAVLEEGKTFFDFKPGMALNEVMNVFLPRYSNSHEKFIMASQADRLRLSPCYQQSDMTCITCHNPHQSVEVTSKNHFNVACAKCHNQPEQTPCSASEADRLAESNNCVSCHMPKAGSIDIPHVRITDHYLSRNNTKAHPISSEGEAQNARPSFLGLEILTKTKATPLEMARGYIALFDKYVNSPVMLDSARYYLDQSTLPAKDKFKTEVHYFFARGDYSELRIFAANQVPQDQDDAWTAYRIGEAHYNGGFYPEALAFYQRATELMPYNLDFQEKLGTTYIRIPLLDDAIKTFNFILSENPKRPISLTNLGYAYILKSQMQTAEDLYDRALTLDPDYVQALLNKVAVRQYHGDLASVRKLLKRVLQIEPGNARARQLLGEIGI